MSSPVHTWLADYAAHLDEGSAALAACGTPDAEWVQGCQDFDDQLRTFGAEAIGRAANVAPGQDLLESLREAQGKLDAAFAEHRATLQGQLETMAKGRKGLRGYGEAGRRMTDGSSLYIERRY